MILIYIGYDSHGKLNLFSSANSSNPCSDQFPIDYNTDMPFKFEVMNNAPNVFFARHPSITWYDCHNNPTSRPANISEPHATPEQNPRVLTFSDSNKSTTEITHRFALLMIENGQPTSIGAINSAGPQISSPDLNAKRNKGLVPVDPTIIEKGDAGSGHGKKY